MIKYYLDTCIWRDYFEDRTDGLRPLGEWAFQLIKQIIAEEGLFIFSNLAEKELRDYYSESKFAQLLETIPNDLLVYVRFSHEQFRESLVLAKKFDVPKKDALHLVIARDASAVLVSRDNHFFALDSIYRTYKPEELI